MTVTTATVSEIFTAREDWRETMIDLALTAYNDGSYFDDDIAATIANSLSDVRVRDTLLWYVSTLHKEGMDIVDTAFRHIWYASECKMVEVAAFIGVVAMMRGDLQSALLWSTKSLAIHPGYNLAGLTFLSVTEGLPAGSIASMFSDLSYEAVRHGR